MRGLNAAQLATDFYANGTFACSGDLLFEDAKGACTARVAILNEALVQAACGDMIGCDVSRGAVAGGEML